MNAKIGLEFSRPLAFLLAILPFAGLATGQVPEDSLPPPTGVTRDEAHLYFETARHRLKSVGDPKLQPRILLDILLVAERVKNETEQNRAIVALLARFPKSMETRMILEIAKPNAISSAVVASFECAQKEANFECLNDIFLAARNLYGSLGGKTGDKEFLAILLLTNCHFNDENVKLSQDQVLLINQEILELIKMIKITDKKVIKMDEYLFYKCVYSYVYNCGLSVRLKHSGLFALNQAIFHAENGRLEQALATMEACQTENRTFGFLFAQGWLRSDNRDIEGASASFRAIIEGGFTTREKEIAADSLRMIQNQAASKARVLAEFLAAIDSFKTKLPKEFFAEITYNTSKKDVWKILTLVNADESRIEIAVFKDGKNFLQFETTRFETKIYSNKSGVITKFDGQRFIPTFRGPTEVNRGSSDSEWFKDVIGEVDWDNTKGVSALVTFKKLLENPRLQSAEAAGPILRNIERQRLYFEIQEKGQGTISASFVKPDLAEGKLTRYGIDKCNGKIVAGRWGKLTIDRLEYNETGFGDIVSKHMPNVNTTRGKIKDQISLFTNLIQMLEQ